MQRVIGKGPTKYLLKDAFSSRHSVSGAVTDEMPSPLDTAEGACGLYFAPFCTRLAPVSVRESHFANRW
jgi:hypothetical protein